MRPVEWRMNSRVGIMILIGLACLVLLYLLYSGGRSGEDGTNDYVDKTIKISNLISAAIQLVESGGDKIVEIRKMDDNQIGQLSKGHTKEGKSEYVTLGDQISHQIITSGLKALWPQLHYRSEENDRAIISHVPVRPPKRINVEVAAVSSRDEAVAIDNVAVWIDPLDATQEYTEGAIDKSLLNFVTVMICIAVKGKPIAGIIHEPYSEDPRTGALGVTKWAWVGHGVSRSLQREIQSATTDEDTVRVIASRSHAGDVFTVAESGFMGYKKVQRIIAAGSGYKALQVAERKADLYLHTTDIKKWDICAGDAVLRTLGGHMTTMTGEDIDYGLGGDPKNMDGILATATESEHAQYLERLKF